MKLGSRVSTPNDTTFNLSLRAQAACERAKELEEAGEFEEARGAISEFWQRIGDRPQVEGLDDIARADVLLRSGALSGWIGSARQLSGAQEIAKDLISESAGAFDKLGLVERVAEARIDLAICYWREGAFDEARITLDDALLRLGNLDSEQRLRAFQNKAVVETASKRYREALRLFREATPLFEASRNHALKGKFCNVYAVVLKNIGLSERRDDYIDRALIEYSAASFHLEQANHKRVQGMVENNLAFLFLHLRRFTEAHDHLARARSIFASFKDKGLVASVDDSRARTFLAQGQFSEAERLARASVRALEEGDELSILAEALTTHGTALARLGNFSKARAALEKAIATAHNAGNPEAGGVAALSMAEEMAQHLPSADLRTYYRMAESDLLGSERADIQDRLGKCARMLLSNDWAIVSSHEAPHNSGSNGHAQLSIESSIPSAVETSVSMEETNAPLEALVLQYEGNLIKQALETADGSVTRAARMLGVTHQGLAFILNGRHRDLLTARKPVKRRRRSIIRFH